MGCNILLLKETRAGEKRVGLVPEDVERLIKAGHQVYIEQEAGAAAGFPDEAYQTIGAKIRQLAASNKESFQQLFENIDILVRAKRPERQREQLENQAATKNTILIGALDPFEKSGHLEEYQQAGIKAYSIDQLELPVEDPMNLLAAMSKIAGKLALIDAIEKSKNQINKVVVIGYGVVGQAAVEEARHQGLATTVILSNQQKAIELTANGVQTVLLDRELSLTQQQNFIKNQLLDADIVITSARKANQPAPLLIPKTTLQAMKPGAVIVDMALSEGGNVEGSEHDATLELGNQVLVTNVSGYPKAMPHESSKQWSKATTEFLLQLIEDDFNSSCLITG